MTDAPARGPRDDKSGKDEPVKKGTEYVVLMQAGEDSKNQAVFTEIGRATGTTDTQAISKACEGRGFPVGIQCVAVPTRNWRLRTEKVDTITRKSWV